MSNVLLVLWLLPFARTVIFTRDVSRRWPQGLIPFERAPNINDDVWRLVVRGMDTWKQNTCITFAVRDVNAHADFVQFVHAVDQCETSTVGKDGGSQPFYVSPACQLRDVLRELGRLIGLLYEQTRPDRDQYVMMQFNNMQPAQQPKFKLDSNAIYPYEYDYNSIMHFGQYSFNLNDLPTCLSPKPIGDPFASLSPADIKGVNWLYVNCGASPFPLTCASSRERLVGNKPREVIWFNISKPFEVHFFASFSEVFFVSASKPTTAQVQGPTTSQGNTTADLTFTWKPERVEIGAGKEFKVVVSARPERGLRSINCTYTINVERDQTQICENRAANPFTDCGGEPGTCTYNAILPCTCKPTHHGVYCENRLIGQCPSGSLGNGFESLPELRAMFTKFYGVEQDIEINYAQQRVGVGSLQITSSSSRTGVIATLQKAMTPLHISFWARINSVAIGTPLAVRVKTDSQSLLAEISVTDAVWYLGRRSSKVGAVANQWTFVEVQFDYEKRTTQFRIDRKEYIRDHPWDIHTSDRAMRTLELLSLASNAIIWFDELVLDCTNGTFPTLTPSQTPTATPTPTLTSIPTHTGTPTHTLTSIKTRSPTPTVTSIPTHTATPTPTIVRRQAPGVPIPPTVPTPSALGLLFPTAPTPAPAPPPKKTTAGFANSGTFVLLIILVILLALLLAAVVFYVLVGISIKGRRYGGKRRFRQGMGLDTTGDNATDDNLFANMSNTGMTQSGNGAGGDKMSPNIQTLAGLLSSNNALSGPSIKMYDNSQFRPYKPDHRPVNTPLDHPPINNPSKPAGFPGYLPISPALGTIAAYIYPSQAQVHGVDSAAVARLKPYKRNGPRDGQDAVLGRDFPTDTDSQVENIGSYEGNDSPINTVTNPNYNATYSGGPNNHNRPYAPSVLQTPSTSSPRTYAEKRPQELTYHTPQPSSPAVMSSRKSAAPSMVGPPSQASSDGSVMGGGGVSGVGIPSTNGASKLTPSRTGGTKTPRSRVKKRGGKASRTKNTVTVDDDNTVQHPVVNNLHPLQPPPYHNERVMAQQHQKMYQPNNGHLHDWQILMGDQPFEVQPEDVFLNTQGWEDDETTITVSDSQLY